MAKSLYLQRLKAQGAHARDEEADQRYADIVGGDPLSVGVEANRQALETIGQFAYDQGIIGGMPSVDTLFTPSTLGLA